MDLLSRLIAGSAATSPTKQKLNTPSERLTACKRICNALQQIWRNGTRLSEDSNATAHVAGLLHRMNTILHDESRKAAPHSCLMFTASTQIYIIVTKLALSSDSPEIILEASQFFHILINGEVEGVLDSKIFARALVDLVRRNTIFATIVVGEQGEAGLVELLFEIATKIRLDPHILPGWFYPERDSARSRQAGAEARRAQFPLFYLLVDYVHHDGSMGDFARTALLYLTETASQSKSLEKWMIESDLAPQMASGLSALYSRLSRKVPVMSENEKALPIIALSDTALDDADKDEDQEESQQNIKAFLSYLAFWQDTLNHCKSVEVKETLLDHFQILFVQQLLYPSLLESSDVAGGSTSAVILHLYRIVDTLDHEQLMKRMLQYLLASTKQDVDPSSHNHNRPRLSISRHRSIEELNTRAQLANSPSPDLFNLYDLLVISLRSRHSQTVNASLKLITMILRRHHPFVLGHLFNTQFLTNNNAKPTLDVFNDTLMILFDLSETIARVDTADESYEAAVHDGRIWIEQHKCLLVKNETTIDAQLTPNNYMILPTCKLFSALLDLLRSFFANDTTTNVTLTETFISIASCQHLLLRSWLVSDTHDDSQSSIQIILTKLSEQIKEWKTQFTDWDALFVQQRTMLAGGMDFDNVRRGSVQSRTSNTQVNPAPSSSTAGRSSTPRGRKAPPPAFGSINGAFATSPKLGASPARVTTGSPLYQTSFPSALSEEIAGTVSVRGVSCAPSTTSTAVLAQQVVLPIREITSTESVIPGLAERLRLDSHGSGASTPSTEIPSGALTPTTQIDLPRITASLGHILTNAIILQEFIFELAALYQIRGPLFDEVDLS